MTYLVIRTLNSLDLDRADEILASAFGFGESRQPELQRYLNLQPDGWFIGSEGSGPPIAMVGAVNYGSFAYVGMMAVHHNAQRRGIGRYLMEYLLADLDKKNCPIVLLDASALGRPLYLQLGFQDEDMTNIFMLPDNLPHFHYNRNIVESMQPDDLPDLAAFDRSLYGADRSRFLKMLLADLNSRAFLTRDSSGQVSGYLFTQTNGRIGPWLATYPEDAARLLDAALALPYQDIPWVISPSINRESEYLLTETGFVFERCCTHMRLGGIRPPGRRDLIYGQYSLAIG